MFTLVLFCLILTIALVLSFGSKNILKRDRHLSLFHTVALMMVAFYCDWDMDSILIYIAVGLLIVALSFSLNYFLVFKHYGGIKRFFLMKYNDVKEGKVEEFINLVIVVLPLSIKSELMAIILVTYLIYNRYMFYRRFSSIV